MSEDAELVNDAVQRMVNGVHPRKIVLFGSAARGEAGPHSDLDFLVIMADGHDRTETTYAIFKSLRGLGRASDIIVVLESDVVSWGDNPYLIIHTALTQGREVYRAA